VIATLGDGFAHLDRDLSQRGHSIGFRDADLRECLKDRFSAIAR
jgi:hypothetical protein